MSLSVSSVGSRDPLYLIRSKYASRSGLYVKLFESQLVDIFTADITVIAGFNKLFKGFSWKLLHGKIAHKDKPTLHIRLRGCETVRQVSQALVPTYTTSNQKG